MANTAKKQIFRSGIIVSDSTDTSKNVTVDVGTNVPASTTVTMTVPPANGQIGYIPEEKTGNFTAVLGLTYIVTANCTVTDPSPVQAKGFYVIVRNGTATVGGTAYASGYIIYRYHHSGSWLNIVIPSLATYNTWSNTQVISGGSAASGITPSGTEVVISGGEINSGAQIKTATTFVSDRGAGALPALTITASWLRLANADGVNTGICADSWGAPAFFLEGRRAGGTRSTPSATGAGENIIYVRAYGYGTTYTTNRSASYAIKANSLWSGSNQETAHVWEGTPSGSTTVATWMTLDGIGLAVNNNLSVGGKFSLGTRSTLTIATGAITITKSFHDVDTEAAAATDDLDTINGGTDGQIIVLRATSSSRDVVIKDGTGNIQCNGDFTMNNAQDRIGLIYEAGTTTWFEIFRSDNGA